MFLKKKLFGLIVCTAPLVSLTSHGKSPVQQQNQNQQNDVSVSDIYARLQAKCYAYKNDPSGQRDPNFKIQVVCDGKRVTKENSEIHTKHLSGDAAQALTFKVKAEDHCFDPYGIPAQSSEVLCEKADIFEYTPKAPLSIEISCDDLTPAAVTQLCHERFNEVCPEVAAPTQQTKVMQNSSSSSDSKSSSDGFVAQQQQQQQTGKGKAQGCEKKKVNTVDTCGFYN